MFTYVQKCMQWRKWRDWRKIASCWRFKLDAKSGPFETGDFGENGDFGEIGDFGKNRHACNGETGKKSPAISAIFANACISGHISECYLFSFEV